MFVKVFTFQLLVLSGFLGSNLMAAVPASEAICVFQDDRMVFGAINPNLDFYADNYTLRQLAEIEVSLLSKTPLKLLSDISSYDGTSDGSRVTLGPCTVVGAGFFVELDDAVFNLFNKEASGISYVFSDSSIKKIAEQYIPHSNTFASVVYHPDEIRLNRLRLPQFIRDSRLKQIPIPKSTEDKLTAKTHTIDVMWDTKRLFSGKASFEHNGDEKRHRQVLLGCALTKHFRIPFPEIESASNGNVRLVSSEEVPPFTIVIDDRLSTTLLEMNLEQHPAESTHYQISPLLWPKITERLLETRNLSYFKQFTDKAGENSKVPGTESAKPE